MIFTPFKLRELRVLSLWLILCSFLSFLPQKNTVSDKFASLLSVKNTEQPFAKQNLSIAAAEDNLDPEVRLKARVVHTDLNLYQALISLSSIGGKPYISELCPLLMSSFILGLPPPHRVS